MCLLDASDVCASMAMAVLSLWTVFVFFISLVKNIKCMCVCWCMLVYVGACVCAYALIEPEVELKSS